MLRCSAAHTWAGSGACPTCGEAAVETFAPVGNFKLDSNPMMQPQDPAATVLQVTPFQPAKSSLSRLPSIPGYTILEEIGSGGMGAVYRAKQESLHREVALKLIRAGEMAQEIEQQRFLREAETIASLDHPNIVRLFESGRFDGRPYYTMELVAGGSLADRQRAGPLLPRDAAKICAAIARAADHAHRKGIVHRDLKPANVLMAEGDTPKVMDFGVAKRLEGTEGLTQTGQLIGTPEFMAPEQAEGKKEVDSRADIYAIGAILYKLLTAQSPIIGDSVYDLLKKIASVDPVAPSKLHRGIPRDLDGICRKCLEKNPDHRYPTAAALADDLDRFLSDERIRVGWTPPWRRLAKWGRRRPAAAAALASAILFAAAISAFLAIYKPAPPDLPETPEARLHREEVTRRVDSLLRAPPTPDRESPHPVVVKPTLPKPDLTAFVIINDDRVVDLRAWRRVPPNDPAAVSYVVINSRRTVMKAAEAETYETEFRTSGRDAFVRGLAPNAEKARVLESAAPVIVGGQHLKMRQVSLEIRTLPVGREFTAECQATFVDSMQKPEDEWLGLIGFKGSLRSSMLILFPKDRPFKDCHFKVAPNGNTKPAPYTGPIVRFQGENNGITWLYWQIGNPEDGNVYRVDWTW